MWKKLPKVGSNVIVPVPVGAGPNKETLQLKVTLPNRMWDGVFGAV
jgi:hypothetical protein